MVSPSAMIFCRDDLRSSVFFCPVSANTPLADQYTMPRKSGRPKVVPTVGRFMNIVVEPHKTQYCGGLCNKRAVEGASPTVGKHRNKVITETLRGQTGNATTNGRTMFAPTVGRFLYDIEENGRPQVVPTKYHRRRRYHNSSLLTPHSSFLIPDSPPRLQLRAIVIIH